MEIQPPLEIEQSEESVDFSKSEMVSVSNAKFEDENEIIPEIIG